MEYARFGHSGLKVSRVCLGCMTYGSPQWKAWVLDEEHSVPFIRQALELGINFFDTANMYSLGGSEEIVGRALRRFAAREDYVLATKVFFPMSDRPNDSGLSRKHILASVDASLKRLATDYVDLLVIHRFDPQTPIEETVDALDTVVRAGKVRYLGGSTMDAFARQRRRPYQMIPVSLFRQPVFSLSLVCSSLSFLALSSAYTALPFLLERGAAAVMREVALYMMIPPLFTAAANAGVVVLLRHFSETLLCSLGMVAMAVGLAMLGALNPSGPTLYLALALLGLGFGIFQTPNNRMILGTASADRSGNVSGTLAVARTIGQTGESTVVSVSLATLAHNGGAIALCIAAAAAAASGVVGLGRNSRSD